MCGFGWAGKGGGLRIPSMLCVCVVSAPVVGTSGLMIKLPMICVSSSTRKPHGDDSSPRRAPVASLSARRYPRSVPPS